MPWAELFMWVWQFLGALLLIAVFIVFLAAPRKTNKTTDRPWDRS